MRILQAFSSFHVVVALLILMIVTMSTFVGAQTNLLSESMKAVVPQEDTTYVAPLPQLDTTDVVSHETLQEWDEEEATIEVKITEPLSKDASRVVDWAFHWQGEMKALEAKMTQERRMQVAFMERNPALALQFFQMYRVDYTRWQGIKKMLVQNGQVLWK